MCVGVVDERVVCVCERVVCHKVGGAEGGGRMGSAQQ